MWGLVPEWTVLEEAAIGREDTHEGNNDQDHHQRHPGQDQQLVPHIQADQLLRHLVNSRVRAGVVLILAWWHVGSISNNHSTPLNGNRFRDPSFTSQRTTLKFLLNLIYENISHWLHGRQCSVYVDGERSGNAGVVIWGPVS